SYAFSTYTSNNENLVFVSRDENFLQTKFEISKVKRTTSTIKIY
ncbi:hypothetical protein DOY81_001777, partial [Sarcophaga bullata]